MKLRVVAFSVVFFLGVSIAEAEAEAAVPSPQPADDIARSITQELGHI